MIGKKLLCTIGSICRNPAAAWPLIPVILLSALASGIPARCQENYPVTEVSIRGNRTFSGDLLRKQIAAHGKRGFLGLFSGGEEFLYGEEAVARDAKRLQRFYQQEGFLNVSVTHGVYDVDDADQKVAVAFRIAEGGPVLVGRVRWRIARAGAADSRSPGGIDSLLQSFDDERRMVSGARFRDNAALEDRKRFIRHFADSGYPYTQVEPELDVDTTALRVDITWRIDPGPPSRFGGIFVTGNEHVPSSSILEQLAFKTGDRFDQSLLSRSQERVHGLGMFRVVAVVAQLDTSRAAQVPVQITVVESPRISSEFGAGYGREEEFRVHNHSRFFGVLGETKRLDLDLKHSALEPYRIELAWTTPAFLTPLTSITLSPFIRRQTEPGFALDRYGGTAELDHRFARHVDGSLIYLFERVKLDEQSISTVDQSRPDLTLLYNKSSVAIGVTADMSSPALSPERGTRLYSSLQASGLGLGSRYHFYKLLLEIRHYRRLSGFSLSSRAKWGGIKSVDDDRFVPVEERLFSGGSKSVRGWPRAELGPIVDGVPLGGTGLLEGGIELRRPLLWKISGALFMDAGNVWEEIERISLGGIRYSAGTGLRYQTPIGPIRIDFARPVWDERTAWLMHVSVGEAF